MNRAFQAILVFGLLAIVAAGCATRRAIVLPTVRAPLYRVEGIKRVGILPVEACTPVPKGLCAVISRQLQRGFGAYGRAKAVLLEAGKGPRDVDAIVISRVWYTSRVSDHKQIWIYLNGRTETMGTRPYREVTAELSTEFTLVELARGDKDLPSDRIVATVTDTARYAAKANAGGPRFVPGATVKKYLADRCTYRFLRTVAYSAVDAVLEATISDDLYALLNKGRYKEALAYVEKEYPDAQNNARHAFLRGLCSDALGLYRDADRYYSIAYADSPGNPEYVAAIARIDAILGNNR